MIIQTKQDLVAFLLDQNLLVDPLLIEQLPEERIDQFTEILCIQKKGNALSDEDIRNAFEQLKDTKATVPERDYTIKERYASFNRPLYTRITDNYKERAEKRVFKHFVANMNKRFQAISKILRQRPDLLGLTSISKVVGNQLAAFSKTVQTERRTTSLIGLVKELRETKNGHTMMTLEDPTGEMKVLLSKNREDLQTLLKDIVLDEVLAVVGTPGNGIFFANHIFFPEIPLTKELKKAPDEAYMIIMGDVHIGSNDFMHAEFDKFIKWIQGEMGDDEQQRIAKLVKYVVFPGDLIEGVGIHPNQEDEIEVPDVKAQYKRAAKMLAQIPQAIDIIICPGNHDAVRLEEPQPILDPIYAEDFHEMKNVILTTSPGMVRIHQTDKFPGFDVLLYHGNSYFYYGDKIEKLRNAGGADRTDLIMRYLLQKRHLAPTYSSTVYIPDSAYDPLVIEKVPDFFISGHVHKASASTFRNVTCISGSCWNGISPYALKFGNHPEPSRIVLVNLNTREVKIMKF